MPYSRVSSWTKIPIFSSDLIIVPDAVSITERMDSLINSQHVERSGQPVRWGAILYSYNFSSALGESQAGACTSRYSFLG